MEELCKKPKIKCKTLVVHDGRYRTLFTKKFENRKKWVNKDEKKILSYIPGTVLKVFIKPALQVKKGDKALILEAMKMENAIACPVDGIIKGVYVKTGDKIPKNFVMFEYEEIN